MKRETYYKKPLKALYKLAVDYFHKVVRLEDPICFTCTKDTEECGHYNHGGNKGMTFWIDFNRKNNHGQCTRCNHILSGNLRVYSVNLEKKYGFGIIQELDELTWKDDTWTKDDLINIIEDCKIKIKLLKNKNADIILPQ